MVFFSCQSSIFLYLLVQKNTMLKLLINQYNRVCWWFLQRYDLAHQLNLYASRVLSNLEISAIKSIRWWSAHPPPGLSVCCNVYDNFLSILATAQLVLSETTKKTFLQTVAYIYSTWFVFPWCSMAIAVSSFVGVSRSSPRSGRWHRFSTFKY